MYSRKSRRRSLRVCLICAGACVPVLIVAYAAMAPHDGHAADVANVQVYGGGAQVGGGSQAGGWGRGGYTMMPGPGGTGSSVDNAANAAATTSENWAGYASAGNEGQFTSVSASWTQPTVTCSAEETFSSFWVGLDGDGTPSVEQTGTEADCDGGSASYQGWFEMFPNAPVFYNNPVDPGDAMSASVTANGAGSFTLTLTDTTQGWTQTTNQTSNTAELGSAEIIAEAPSDGNVLPLSNFGTVSFSNVTADSSVVPASGTARLADSFQRSRSASKAACWRALNCAIDAAFFCKNAR